MRVIPNWTEDELNGGARYSSSHKISQCLEDAVNDMPGMLKIIIREQTAQLEKVIDTLELTDYKRGRMELLAETLDKSLSQYVNGIIEKDITIDTNYLIWATIAIRKKHEMLGIGSDVDTDQVLTEAILA